MAIVYIVINLVTGLRYIGATSKPLMERRRAHHSVSFGPEQRKYKFGAALREYGRDNFEWVVLAEYKTYDDALAGEIYFIEKMNPEYNVSRGGRGLRGVPSHNKRKVLCLEDGAVFDSCQAAGRNYGLSGSVEISQVCNGKQHTAAGKHFVFYDRDIPEDERKQMIKLLLKKQINDRAWENRNPEWVRQQVAARKKLGAARKKPAHMTVRGRRQMKKKKYIGQSMENWRKYAHLGPMVNAKRVLCLDDGTVFESASAAARHYGACKSALIQLCNGDKRRKTVKGLRFIYYIGPQEKEAA